MAPRETHISRQAKRLSSGQIDRRRFVMQALATGVSMPTALSLASRAEAAQPRRGGTLRLGASSTEALERYVLEACRDRLFDLDSYGQPVPSLANSFEAQDDGQAWIIDLRQDVLFHSGRPLRPEDVVWSLQNSSGIIPRHLIKTVRSIEPHQVEIELRVPHQDFPKALATVEYSIGPTPLDDGDPADFDGTGAYRLEVAETAVDLVRNATDWRADRGYFERVAIYVLADAQSRQSAIMNDDVDVVDDLDPRGLAMLAQIDDVSVVETQGQHHLRIEFPSEGPFASSNTKVDFVRAIDRTGLLERVFLGHGDVVPDVPVLFDAVERADPLIEKTFFGGQSTTLPLTLSDPKSRVLMACAEELIASAGRAGLRLELDFENPMAARVSIECDGMTKSSITDNAHAAGHLSDDNAFIPLLLNNVWAHRSKITALQPEARPVITKWWFKAPV